MIDIDDSEIDDLPSQENKEALSPEEESELDSLIEEALKSRNKSEVIRGEAAITVAEAEKERKLFLALKAKLEFERRKDQEDRRQKAAVRDEHGNVSESSYKGPDRRSGIDRRAERENALRKEYHKFLIRSASYGLGITTILISLTFLLFAPEYFKVKEFLKGVDFKAIASAIGNSGVKDISVSASLNRYIGNVENYVKDLAEATDDAKNIKGNDPNNDLGIVKNIFDNLNKISAGDGDNRGTSLALHGLKSIIFSTLTSNPEDIKKTLINSANVDDNVRNVLEASKGKSVAAAALLFALNEFRDNIYSGNSYESDITLIKKLAGDDPEMNAAIEQLLPYAKKGVMSKDTLSAELKSIANEIVLSKMRGEDANVKAKALTHLENIKQQVRQNELSSANGQESEEVTVAKAQVLLEQGDINGAIAELQNIKGNSSETASSWINKATQTSNANASSEQLVEQILKNAVSGSGFNPESLIKMILPVNTRPVYLSP